MFRFVFGEPAHAASELRAVLPAALADRLDLASLRPVNGSFVDEELTTRHADVLDDLTKLDKAALRARPVTIPVRLTARLLRIVPAHPGDVIAALDPDDIADLRHVLRLPGGACCGPPS